MIYGYGMWDKIVQRLLVDLPLNSIRNIQKYNKVKQLLAKDFIQPTELFFFLRFSEGDRKLQKELADKGFHLYPNPNFSFFIEKREEYLPKIDEWSQFPLKRIYTTNHVPTIKREIEKHFGSQPVVMKVGNLHASEEKYLISENRIIPVSKSKYKYKPMEVTIEEYVPNARSIRIGIVGNPNQEENIYITEHINSKTWLKNNAPEEENTYSYQERKKLNISHIDELIEETKEMATRYQTNLIGVDWVISEEKTGILELNDMIGMPDGEFAFELFYREIKRVCEEYLKNK